MPNKAKWLTSTSKPVTSRTWAKKPAVKSCRPLSLITAHEDLAHVAGLRVRAFNYAFVLVLTVTVTVTIRLVGILLVGALLVIPPAAARLLARTLRQEIWLAVAFGIVTGVGGVVGSYAADVPCGPAIVLTGITLFLVALAVSNSRRTMSSDRRLPEEA